MRKICTSPPPASPSTATAIAPRTWRAPIADTRTDDTTARGERAIIGQSHRSGPPPVSRSGRSGRVRREPVPVPVRPFVYTHATKNAGSRAKDIFAQKVTFVWEKPILAIESRASSRVVARAPLCPRCPRPGKSSTDRLCVRARAPSSVSSNSPTHDASTRRDNQSNESRDFSPHLHRAAPSSRRSRSRSRSPARRPRRPSLRPRSSRRTRARDRSIVARVRPSRRRVPTRRSAGRVARREESLASRPGMPSQP